MFVTIDRIEKNTLILENEAGTIFAVPAALLPEAKEGDVLCITIDKTKTEERKKQVKALMNELFVD